MIVCKFGGTSVASKVNAENIKKIASNKKRHFFVVSALGKSDVFDKKVTDELYECFFIYQKSKIKAIIKFVDIVNKYVSFSQDLNCDFYPNNEVQKVVTLILKNKLYKDYIISRGEYFSAMLYASYLKLFFLDAKDYIIFNKCGDLNYSLSKKRFLSLNFNKRYVIGGFYGATKNGIIKTFPRGGSDITGAVIAKLLNLQVYENYTDVDGIYDKDPNLFKGATSLPILNYKTTYQMADAGNEVVHKTALKILKNSNIFLVVKNTNNLDNFGSVLVDSNFNFNNLYICRCRQFVMCAKNVTEDLLMKIKINSELKKIVFSNGVFYIFLSEIYASKNYFSSFKDVLWVQELFVFSVFSNVVIDKKHIKILKKIQKKLKNCVIMAQFLSLDNNFVIMAQDDKKIIYAINKYLQT